MHASVIVFVPPKHAGTDLARNYRPPATTAIAKAANTSTCITRRIMAISSKK